MSYSEQAIGILYGDARRYNSYSLEKLERIQHLLLHSLSELMLDCELTDYFGSQAIWRRASASDPKQVLPIVGRTIAFQELINYDFLQAESTDAGFIYTLSNRGRSYVKQFARG